MVLDLSQVRGGMLAEAGGKAANLGELIGAGLPVPPGWVVTTDAYRRVAAEAGLDGLIAAGGDGLAEKARERLLATPVPPDIARAVAVAYEKLPAGAAVAVRSSATAEDLPHASFAGQQDTYLNVTGAEAVLDAVRRCWASLWTDRAVAYREANGVDHAGVSLAVVVQEMVDARVAGVMFTANPVTGRRHEAVIDAAPGLGEAVVSGAVNPDRFVADARTGEIRERRAGDKRLLIRALPGGGTERLDTPSRDGFCLTDDQVRELAALGARVEEHYGAPQDTEWAIGADGGLWLTQARPITTLYPLPEPRDGLRVYFSFNVAQGVMGPLTPLGQATIKLLASGAAGAFGRPPADPREGPPVLVSAGERLWIDITTPLRSRAGRVILPRVMQVGEARTVALVRELAADPRLPVTHTSRRPLLRAAAHFGRRLRVPAKVLRALTRPERALAYTRKLGEDLDGHLRLPETATPADRLRHAQRMLGGAFPAIISIMPTALTGYGLYALAARLSGTPLGEMQEVLRSVPNNPTTEMDLELWRLATRIEPEVFRREPVAELVRRYRAGTLPPVAQREITAFLGRYGHRGVAEIDIGVPRWSEEPGHILGALANYLRMDADADHAPAALFARGEVAARRAVDEAVAAARRRGRLRAAVVRFALGRARQFAGLRELPKFYAVKAIAGVRASLLEVGGHLVGEGVLDSAQDVFFLDFAELEAAVAGEGGDVRETVAARRAVHERERRRRHVPRVMLSDGTEPEAAMAGAAPEGAITGTPASSGTVTGTARVVLDPVGAQLEPGEILVCPSTDPGWTPLFLTAGGLVMEMGGAMSHGAVVAREYGIPAVVGVPDATHRIASGAQVTVNGAVGTVTTPA
ncbi:PEP/pyruvate-binding domain-containing protein [Nonomuraea sp. C10]|uniref:PEP/pyruvate-binding domain-containing protein n=1 Tax=Nonomuraea sp. C10 TaxID=2600577 RepID=UPI0011CDD74C|nr:PEP/pyruvate-binding domain-containing protein [Nonomuraea sp. C10]TXK39543.1 phosphoenolpyruvate synthase [Nonomuraea sp. C10]